MRPLSPWLGFIGHSSWNVLISVRTTCFTSGQRTSRKAFVDGPSRAKSYRVLLAVGTRGLIPELLKSHAGLSDEGGL